MINNDEILLARKYLDACRDLGASGARVSLSKSVMDSISLVDGKVEKVLHSADRSIFLHIFSQGKYGTFSTNMLESSSVETFVRHAIDTVAMFAPDPFRKLPEKDLCAFGEALTGREAGLYDEDYQEITSEERIERALSQSAFNGDSDFVSEELEYSDSLDDNYLIDSNGFEGRHIETSYSVSCESTVKDGRGRKYSSYWWDASPFSKGLRQGVTDEALRRARLQKNPRKCDSGRRVMVVEANVASRLFAPLLNALQASAVQQKNSFLDGCLGKKMFSDRFTVCDRPREVGKPGSRLFDTEGVATKERKLIEGGVVNCYFVNTYMSGKMGLPQTVEGISRPFVEPFVGNTQANEVSLPRILSECSEGILVTGFNGGNCNTSTGNFSYGVEGFLFRNGEIVHPVKEMVVTGNMLSLWKDIIAVGSDRRDCSRWSLPSLAFENVDFSA